jgi:hypothetical protein
MPLMQRESEKLGLRIDVSETINLPDNGGERQFVVIRALDAEIGLERNDSEMRLRGPNYDF